MNFTFYGLAYKVLATCYLVCERKIYMTLRINKSAVKCFILKVMEVILQVNAVGFLNKEVAFMLFPQLFAIRGDVSRFPFLEKSSRGCSPHTGFIFVRQPWMEETAHSSQYGLVRKLGLE